MYLAFGLLTGTPRPGATGAMLPGSGHLPVKRARRLRREIGSRPIKYFR
jgi:hypothetical protein